MLISLYCKSGDILVTQSSDTADPVIGLALDPEENELKKQKVVKEAGRQGEVSAVCEQDAAASRRCGRESLEGSEEGVLLTAENLLS